MKRLIAAAVLLLAPALLVAAGTGAKEGDYKLFPHEDHLANQADCKACHKASDMDVVPSLEVCKACHDEAWIKAARIPARTTHDGFWYRDHSALARLAQRNCSVCHTEDWCLDCHKAGFADRQGKTNIHRSDFRVTHPIPARTDDRSCKSCHEAVFCVKCHSAFRPEELAFVSHRRGWSDLSLSGATHAAFPPDSCRSCHTDSVLSSHEWTSSHAREARRALPTCQSCHPDAAVCLKCHSAREGLIVNPHPKNWDDIKDILNGASGGKTCRRCH